MKVKSNSNPTLKLAPSQGSSPSIKGHDQADLESLPPLKRCMSIKYLPPTTLNYGSDEDSSDEDYPYTSSLSHNVGNDISRGYDYYYDYNTVYPSDPYQYQGYQTPDVVDVPENLDMGSNVNYDLIDNNDMAVGTSEHNEHSGGQIIHGEHKAYGETSRQHHIAHLHHLYRGPKHLYHLWHPYTYIPISYQPTAFSIYTYAIPIK